MIFSWWKCLFKTLRVYGFRKEKSFLSMKSTWSSTDIKTKYEKYFFGDFLSADFWQELWE